MSVFLIQNIKREANVRKISRNVTRQSAVGTVSSPENHQNIYIMNITYLDLLGLHSAQQESFLLLRPLAS